MFRFLRYAILALLWAAVAGYVVYAAAEARRVRAGKSVRGLEIEIADSSSQGQLVSSRQVREWISHSGIRTVGTAVDAVDLTGIERLIARNGFVSRADAWVSYPGTLHIRIRQRRPLLRLLTDGMNAYVTSEGYVFAAPQASSRYVPVVTGSYRPPFPPSWTGDVRAHIDERLRETDERIAALERGKYPVYERERRMARDYDNARRLISKRMKRQWWRLERDTVYRMRVTQLKAERLRLRRAYRYSIRTIDEELERIAARQEGLRREQKKLEKSYEDFMKLLTFAEWVEEDDFWRSEVVQITARTTPSGALEVDLTPRSGRHLIRFGRLERIEEKFDKLLCFYRRGLSAVGWETYGTIDVRYRDQVVCRK